MKIDLDLKVKLFNEYLDNGGIESIDFPELLEELSKVKNLPNGKFDPATISPMVNAAMLTYIAEQIEDPFFSDTYMAEYQTLLQKSLFFNQINIETEKEFDEVFKKYDNRQDILFRGLNEAKYRLYSSLQREWIAGKLSEKHTSYCSFLESLIENAKQEQQNILTKNFEISGIDPNNDLAVFSFLQHYGCPTPLLDWTYSFIVALYFATKSINYTNINWEIENYFSVYFFEEKLFKPNSLKEIVETSLISKIPLYKNKFTKNIKARGFTQEQIEKMLPDEDLKQYLLLKKGPGGITFITKINKLLLADIHYFSDFKKDFQLSYNLNNNMNIVNQQGVFTWNSHPTRPLEQVVNERERKKAGNDDKMYIFSECININKKLGAYIKQKLDERNINKDFIYPDPKKIAIEAFRKTK